MKEVWKPLFGEGHYEVSDLGRIKRCAYVMKQKNGREKHFQEIIMSPRTDRKGYKCVTLFLCGSYRTFFVHQLVGKMFVPNPNGYVEINHKDENPANNNASNLEWCEHRYNMNYGTIRERSRENNPLRKCVAQIDSSGKVVANYDSLREASRQTGFPLTCISRACKNESEYKGYKFYQL